MTKEQAIAELVRAAKLCYTTKLAEACRMLIAWTEQPHDCGTCRHAARLANEEPCFNCSLLMTGHPDKWEPKEE